MRCGALAQGLCRPVAPGTNLKDGASIRRRAESNDLAVALRLDKLKGGESVGRHSPCTSEGQGERRTAGSVPGVALSQRGSTGNRKGVGGGATLVAAFTRVPTRTVGSDGMENKALQLTSREHIGGSQLNASVGRTFVERRDGRLAWRG